MGGYGSGRSGGRATTEGGLILSLPAGDAFSPSMPGKSGPDNARRLHLLDLGGDIAGNGLSKLFLTIAAAFAEAERDRIRERIGQVKADQAARGILRELAPVSQASAHGTGRPRKISIASGLRRGSGCATTLSLF